MAKDNGQIGGMNGGGWVVKGSHLSDSAESGVGVWWRVGVLAGRHELGTTRFDQSLNEADETMHGTRAGKNNVLR